MLKIKKNIFNLSINVKRYFFWVMTFSALLVNAQNSKYIIVDSISPDLKTKSNSVIRYNKTKIDLLDYNHMVVTKKRIVTVFNEYGDSDVNANELYSDKIKIKNLQAHIYDANGQEIKKIKEKDFIDESVVDGISLYSDDRKKYLKYVPLSYPYTVVYEAEIDYKTTAFLPSWLPIEGYYVSTEYSEYQIINSSDAQIRLKTENFEGFDISPIGEYHYEAENLLAISPEAYSPSFTDFAPYLKATLTEFDMEGVKGVNNNWEDFGQWMNDKLISDTQELPLEVKEKIKSLTGNAVSSIEKAKIVYQYMQEKTRYISVQVGIGGWKPMNASDVDRLGYGDCKALTNYTQALLQEVGVTSYYSVIYGGKNKRDIDSEFSTTQGNHVILCLPQDNNNIWLECTSQTVPFGYIANFTDDRDALVIKPDGGEIVHTTVYEDADNILNTKSVIELDEIGNIVADVNLESFGTQYGFHEQIQHKTHKEQELYYKNYWDYINNLSILSKELIDNKKEVVFAENVKVEALKYAARAGDRLLFQPNVFNRITEAPPRYKIRKLPLEVDRGFVDFDEFIIKLPDNVSVEALQDSISINNKFGEYEFSIKKINEKELLFKRKFLLRKGYFPNEDYNEFRDFWLKVIKHDKSKIALIKKA